MNSVIYKSLPLSLQYDPFVKACAEAFEIQMLALRKELTETSDLVNLTTQNEHLIDLLAFEKHVDFYEDLTLEEKRNVVKNAIKIHAKKGTKQALISIFELLSLDGVIEEWFTYDGDPFHFKASVEISKNGIDDQTIGLLVKLINTYKNNRSKLETLDVYLTSKSNQQNISALFVTGEEISIYPYQQSSLTSTAKIKTGAAHNGVEQLTVLPEGGQFSE